MEIKKFIERQIHRSCIEYHESLVRQPKTPYEYGIFNRKLQRRVSVIMKRLLIISMLLLTGCQTERINRQLRLSKKHLARAVELGAKLDSIKTQVKATGEVEGVTDSASVKRDVNIDAVLEDCGKLKHQMDSIRNLNHESENLSIKDTTPLDKRVSMVASIKTSKGWSYYYAFKNNQKDAIKALQNHLCTNDSIHKNGTIEIKIALGKVKIPYTLDAWAKAGKAGYNFEIGKTDFIYTMENVQINATPGDIPKWWQTGLRYLGVLLLGIIIGFILGKILKFGINL